VTGCKSDRFVTEFAAGLYTVIGVVILLGACGHPVLARRLAVLTGAATAALDARHRRTVSAVYTA
jgi:hypothetical protein